MQNKNKENRGIKEVYTDRQQTSKKLCGSVLLRRHSASMANNNVILQAVNWKLFFHTRQADINAVLQYLHYCASCVECNPLLRSCLMIGKKHEFHRHWEKMTRFVIIQALLYPFSDWEHSMFCAPLLEEAVKVVILWVVPDTQVLMFFFPCLFFLLSFLFSCLSRHKWIRKHKRKILSRWKWPLLPRNKCNAGLGIGFIPNSEIK